VEFTIRHIVQETPTREEFLAWRKIAGVDKKLFVNVSGKKYKESGLKDRIGAMTDTELFDHIAGEPMLVKRPILVGDDFVLIGFKKPEWEARFPSTD